MRKITQTFEWEVFADAELPPEDLELRKAAYDAASRAFAPYSAFHVGAAVRLADGTVVTGKGPGATCFFAAAVARVLGVAPQATDEVLASMFAAERE